MRHWKIGILSIVATAIAAVAMPAAAADPAMDKAIKSRKAQMALYSWNLGRISAMVKGDTPYDAKVAQGAADNLAALTSMSGAGLWPKGSDQTAMPGATRAKAEIWTTYPAVVEKSTDMAAAAMALAAVADDGLDAVKAKFGDVGKSCGGCHKPFRGPKS